MRVCLLLFSVVACFAEHMYSSSKTGTPPPRHSSAAAGPGHHRVLIIGAGMAGISAGLTLAQAGVSDIAIVEAQNRVGGRMTSSRLNGHVVELGPNWLQELTTYPGGNPLWKMKDKINLEGKYGDYRFKQCFEGAWELNGWEKAAANARVDGFIAKAHRLAEEMYARGEPDISLEQAMAKVGYEPENGCERALFRMNLQFMAASSAHDISFYLIFQPGTSNSTRHRLRRTFLVDDNNNGHDNNVNGHNNNVNGHDNADSDVNSTESTPKFDNWLVTDPRGFSVLAEYLAQQFLLTPLPSDPRLWLNASVTAIDYSQRPVVVLLSSGERLTADFVISTVSIGVLQASVEGQRKNGGLTFTPPMPEAFVRSLNKLDMAEFLKVFIEFPERFWGDYNVMLQAPNATANPYPSTILNLEGFVPDSHILLVGIIGDEARRVGSLPKEEVKRQIMETLSVMYPAAVPLPEPIGELLWKSWTKDPLFHGCFANSPPGVTQKDMDLIRRPLGGDKVFFAGEAYWAEAAGYVHSAYLSGQHTAKALLAAMGVNGSHYDSVVQERFS